MTEHGSRRRSARAGVVLQLRYRSAGHLLVNYCTNLSRGGMFVPAADPNPVGTELTLELSIPGEDARVAAEVRWVRPADTPEGPAGMGLAFSDVDAQLGARIDALVAEFDPLAVHVDSANASVREYVCAQLRTLVLCTAYPHTSAVGLLPQMGAADLVIVDANANAKEAESFLRALEQLEQPPPRVALCEAGLHERRAAVQPLAPVVDTPVDPETLRRHVLAALTRVSAEPKA